MRTILAILTVCLLLSAPALARKEKDCSIKVTHEIYSGRVSPSWTIRDTEDLQRLFRHLRRANAPLEGPGYELFSLGDWMIEDTNHCLVSEHKRSWIWLSPKHELIQVDTQNGKKLYYRDSGNRVLNWIKARTERRAANAIK